MNEEIEYAEMLEIPVSTVSVVHKKRSKKRKVDPTLPKSLKQETALQASVIEQVNDKMQCSLPLSEQEQAQEKITADATLFAECVNSQGKLDFGEIPERIDTVRLYSAAENKRKALLGEMDEEYPILSEEMENDGGRIEMNALSPSEKRAKIVLGVEFAAACALCGAIFITNVFVPQSAINTFFRTLNFGAPAATDTRAYSDFTLASVVSDFSPIELQVSPTGVISFTGESCVYPTADGKVVSLTQSADGTYTVKIAHSETFSAVMSGLDFVYYTEGEEVKSNVPVGYTEGEVEVQVTMYSDGVLLNCFELTEQNCLAWITQE